MKTLTYIVVCLGMLMSTALASDVVAERKASFKANAGAMRAMGGQMHRRTVKRHVSPELLILVDQKRRSVVSNRCNFSTKLHKSRRPNCFTYSEDNNKGHQRN